MQTNKVTHRTKAAHNGWPNYETWNVMLWLDNDEVLYRGYREEMNCFKGRLSAAKAEEIVKSLFWPKSAKTYKACVHNAARLNNLLGDSAHNTLLWHVERL